MPRFGKVWQSLALCAKPLFCKAPVLARSGVSFCTNLFGKKFLSQKVQARGACAVFVICPRCAVKSPRMWYTRFKAFRSSILSVAVSLKHWHAYSAIQRVLLRVTINTGTRAASGFSGYRWMILIVRELPGVVVCFWRGYCFVLVSLAGAGYAHIALLIYDVYQSTLYILS